MFWSRLPVLLCCTAFHIIVHNVFFAAAVGSDSAASYTSSTKGRLSMMRSEKARHRSVKLLDTSSRSSFLKPPARKRDDAEDAMSVSELGSATTNTGRALALEHNGSDTSVSASIASKQKKKVAVAIPVRNRRGYVQLAAYALRASRFPAEDVWIFDDNSTTVSVAELQQWFGVDSTHVHTVGPYADDASIGSESAGPRIQKQEQRLFKWFFETKAGRHYDYFVNLDSDLVAASDFAQRLDALENLHLFDDDVLKGSLPRAVLTTYHSGSPGHNHGQCASAVYWKGLLEGSFPKARKQVDEPTLSGPSDRNTMPLSTSPEPEELCEIQSMGTAGAMFSRGLLRRYLDERGAGENPQPASLVEFGDDPLDPPDVEQPMTAVGTTPRHVSDSGLVDLGAKFSDWGFTKWCSERQGVTLLAPKASLVAHIGMHGSWGAASQGEKAVGFDAERKLTPPLARGVAFFLAGRDPDGNGASFV